MLVKQKIEILADEPKNISCFSCFHINSNLVREAVAEMRNKEAAATTTLLDFGEQVLLHFFILHFGKNRKYQYAAYTNIAKDHLA